MNKDKIFRDMVNLIAEISNAEHEGFEISVCQDFIDDNELWDYVDVIE